MRVSYFLAKLCLLLTNLNFDKSLSIFKYFVNDIPSVLIIQFVWEIPEEPTAILPVLHDDIQ